QPSKAAPGAQPAPANPPADLDGGNTAALQNTIQTTLRNDPIAGGSNITVNVTSNTIELNGTAANGKAKTTAHRIAESYALNRSVVDHVTVSGRGNVSAGGNPGTSATVPSSGATTPAANVGAQPAKQQNQPAPKVPK